MTGRAKQRVEPVLDCATAADFHAWLAAHHGRSSGVLLRIPKRGGPGALTYAQALDAALAWGWIDSQKHALDSTAWLQRFSPRAAKSPWSKINRDKAEALIKARKMRPPGLAAVRRAQADGRWDRAYAGSRTASVPSDLASALRRDARAQAFFDQLDGANRYAILYRVESAKKAETRAQRIARFVEMCGRHETLHPRRAKKA